MQPYMPTPAEIRRAAEAIRQRWDDREFFKRSGGDPDNDAYVVPHADLGVESGRRGSLAASS